MNFAILLKNVVFIFHLGVFESFIYWFISVNSCWFVLNTMFQFMIPPAFLRCLKYLPSLTEFFKLTNYPNSGDRSLLFRRYFYQLIPLYSNFTYYSSIEFITNQESDIVKPTPLSTIYVSTEKPNGELLGI